MDIVVRNRSFVPIGIIDDYKSLIWNDPYNEYGDFELQMPITDGLFDLIKKDYYLTQENSEHVMLIEGIKIETNEDEGNYVTVTGSSSERILERRIVWNKTILHQFDYDERIWKDVDLQDGIKRLLDENLIFPDDPTNVRKIPGISFAYTTDAVISAMRIRKQITGDDLYKSISEISKERGIGFKMVLSSDETGLVFSLYCGKDRSSDQNVNPVVMFSPEFDNLIGSEYEQTMDGYKNVALVAGEDSGNNRKTVSINPDISGIGRYELYVDARDIQSEVYDDDGNQSKLSDEEYYPLLVERGNEKLADCMTTETFEGEADPEGVYKLGIDFFIGDIVQVSNEYGHSGKARITEIVTFHDSSRFSIYPTFEMINENNEETEE